MLGVNYPSPPPLPPTCRCTRVIEGYWKWLYTKNAIRKPFLNVWRFYYQQSMHLETRMHRSLPVVLIDIVETCRKLPFNELVSLLQVFLCSFAASISYSSTFWQRCNRFQFHLLVNIDFMLCLCVNVARTVSSTRCLTWRSVADANAMATRHDVACRHATDDSVASVDTIQSAQTVRDVGLFIMTDRGPERLQYEPMSASVSC